MKDMKKILTVLLITVVSASSLFAATDNTYSLTAQPFTKTSARMEAMGGAGIAVKSNQDSLFVNPASLGAKGLVWDIPSVAVTFYNPYEVNEKTRIFDDFVNGRLTDNLNDSSYLQQLGLDLASIYGKTGLGKVAKVDVGLGVKWGRFATSTDIQVNLLTSVPVNGYASDLSIIPQVDIVQSLGVGFRFFRNSSINFDVGVAARLNIRAYLEAINANTVLKSLNSGSFDFESLVGSKTLYIGYAIPVDIGLNVNFPFGFTFATVARNINGNFNYTVTEPLKNIYSNSDYLGTAKSVFANGTVFPVSVPWSLDLGLGWTPDLGSWEWLADFTLAADFTDTVGFFSDELTGSGFWSRLKLGAEVELFKLFEFRAGINSGYLTVGGGLNMFNILHMEVSYYTTEFGANVGDKPLDALTIRFNTFWER